MASNPVIWFEIYVDDMPRARAFYESVLDVKLQHMPMQGAGAGDALEMWAFPMEQDGAGAAGVLAKMTGFKAGGSSTLIYFRSADCAVEAGRVVAAGGRLHQDKQSIGEYGFIVLAVDTEGNMFGIHSQQ